jgi:hypothetical protein
MSLNLFVRCVVFCVLKKQHYTLPYMQIWLFYSHVSCAIVLCYLICYVKMCWFFLFYFPLYSFFWYINVVYKCIEQFFWFFLFYFPLDSVSYISMWYTNASKNLLTHYAFSVMWLYECYRLVPLVSTCRFHFSSCCNCICSITDCFNTTCIE